MKVAELIQALQQMPADADVHFSYNYGDYWRTQVAPLVDTVELGLVEHSTYHNMDRIIEEDDIEYTDDGELITTARSVVVLG